MKAIVVAVVTSLAIGASAMAQDYGVTVKTNDDVALDAFDTYTCIEGHGVYDRDIRQTIVTAIDRELAAVGITQTDGPADVLVVYHTLQRTDVDLETWRATPDVTGNTVDTNPVGTLVVNLLDPQTSEQLWHARIDEPLELEPAGLAARIVRAVAALFEELPR